MKKTLYLAATTALAATISTSAMAAQMCGVETAQSDGAMIASIGSFEAKCVKDSKCSIGLSSVDGMQLELERASVDGSWLALAKSTSAIDSGAGIDLVFNGDDETRIAPDFLIAAEDMKSVRVDDDVSEIVMTTMLDSKTMKATVQLVGGKQIVHDVKLDGLAMASKWVDCAQAK